MDSGTERRPDAQQPLQAHKSAASGGARTTQFFQEDGLVDRVAKTLYALGGHLHGEYPALAYCRGEPGTVSMIDCSLSLHALRVAANVLAASGDSYMRVTAVPHGDLTSMFYPSRELRVRARCGDAEVGVRLHAFTTGIQCIPASVSAFDWQLLSSASDRLYVRAAAEGPSCDRLYRALQRIRRGVFCLTLREGMPLLPLQALPPPPQTDEQRQERARAHAAAMTQAARLVIERGWRMDDAEMGREGWVVARWDALAGARPPWPPVGMHPTAHSHCAICDESFAASDAVVNLPCNHNFHAMCNRGDQQPSGLCGWAAAGHLTCPCCRTTIGR